MLLHHPDSELSWRRTAVLDVHVIQGRLLEAGLVCEAPDRGARSRSRAHALQ